MARKEILQFLDTVGDGTGTTDMSTTADTYKFVPTSGRGWAKIAGIKLFIMDGGAFQEDFYGHLGAALATGCTCKVVKQAGGDELDLIAAAQFKDNADIRRSGWTFEVQTFSAGNNWVVAVLRPPVDFNRPLVIYDDEELEFDVQDDLTLIVAQNVVIFGEYER